jgi:hypothetical protein
MILIFTLLVEYTSLAFKQFDQKRQVPTLEIVTGSVKMIQFGYSNKDTKDEEGKES